MKCIFLIPFFISFFINLYSQKNVVDYFQLLPDSLQKGYDVLYQNNTWISYSSADYMIFPVVDIKNGFIEIKDDGTGGGTVRMQVAIFVMSDKTTKIGYSYYEFDGVSEHSVEYFFVYENKILVEITSQTIPQISLNYFTALNYNVPENLIQYIDFYFKLPRYGTTITVFLKYSALGFFCNTVNYDPVLKNNSCLFIKNIKKDSLDLKWNSKTGKFY